MNPLVNVLVAVLVCTTALVACEAADAPTVGLEQEDSDPFNAAATGGPTPGPTTSTTQPLDATIGAGVNGACAETVDCRYGLVCDEGECRAIANTPATGFCFLTDECAEGLYCSESGTCRSVGAGLVGAPCTTADACVRGLHCRSFGLMASCADTGAGDIGDNCARTGECLAGLFCGPEQTCRPWFGGASASLWSGLDCADEAESNPRPYFELGGQSGEFFRVPYPNDMYVKDGSVDLSGFPQPGPGVLGFDPIANLTTAADRSQTGFSLTPTVTFRFSSVMDFQTLSGAANGSVSEPTIHFVNVDPESPNYGGGPSYNWHVTDGAGSYYICPRWLAVRVRWDQALAPGTTYAVYLTEGARDLSGNLMGADTDFVAMLASAAPTDELKAHAWDAYGPLRAYLSDKEIPTESVIGGTVFTTQRPQDRMLELRQAIAATGAVTPLNPVLCGSGEDSPCTGEPCEAPGSSVKTVHMQLELPRVQQGVRPFLEPSDGGGVTPAGEPLKLHGVDTVCASLSFPTGDVPEAGWPVVLFAHDSAGDFRSAESGLGELMAEAGAAVLSWNGPMHGARGDADFWPEALVYNLVNPSAVLGSLYQGAADVFSIVRGLKGMSGTASAAPMVAIDASRVALMGHGLGATIGAISAPHEPDVRLTVWSSASAVVSEIMATRLVPVDVPRSVGLMLHESEAEELDTRHPVLALYQGLFEPVDPVAHLGTQPLVDGEVLPQHTLQIQGVGDWYAPSRVTDIVARLVKAELASPILREIEGVASVAPPVTNNVGTEEQPRTSVVIQATPPDGSDGEPAWFAGDAWREDPGVRQQLQDFIQSWIADGVPTLPARTGL
ncbi:MAG: hypothetical protein ACPGU1_05690 [Myxococcota bacterium]